MNNCFCGGDLRSSHVLHYKKCIRCGSYHSLKWQDPKTIYEKNYWTHEQGRSTLQEQWDNHVEVIDGKPPRVDFWLKILSKNWVIGKFMIGNVFEIGCAPGAFLHKITTNEFGCWVGTGIEVDQNVTDWIRNKTNRTHKIITGYFPANLPELHPQNLIASFDVLEHSPEPEAFLKKCFDLSSENAYLLIQTPTILPYDNHFAPFKEDTDRMFKADEHVWIFSEMGLIELANKAGYKLIDSDRWAMGHECFLFKK